METWFLIALVAPALWSVVNLIDVFTVESIYHDEKEATIIVGLFQLVPWIVVLFGFYRFHLPENFYVFILAGVAFTLAMGYFYFKTLFSENDVASLQILLNLAVPITLFLSWFFLDEMLSWTRYLGIALTLFGISILAFPAKFEREKLFSSFGPILGSILFLSMYFFISKIGFLSSNANFFDQYLLFTLGGSLPAFFFILALPSMTGTLLKRVKNLSGSYFFLFLFTELLVLAGTLTSQRALDLAPSASYVATLESLSPFFVILFSVLFVVLRKFRGQGKERLTELYREQYSALPLKIFATILTFIGIYLIG